MTKRWMWSTICARGSSNALRSKGECALSRSSSARQGAPTQGTQRSSAGSPTGIPVISLNTGSSRRSFGAISVSRSTAICELGEAISRTSTMIGQRSVPEMLKARKAMNWRSFSRAGSSDVASGSILLRSMMRRWASISTA